jgi:hypothetical protein
MLRRYVEVIVSTHEIIIQYVLRLRIAAHNKWNGSNVGPMITRSYPSQKEPETLTKEIHLGWKIGTAGASAGKGW